MKQGKLTPIFRIMMCVFALLLAVAIAATCAAFTYAPFLNDKWQISSSGVSGSGGGSVQYFKSDYVDQDELYEAKSALIKDIVREGVVLLKNNGALPLVASTDNKVNVFGRNSVNMVQSIGGGASKVKEGRSDPITAVLASKNITVNQTLFDYYKSQTGYALNVVGRSIGEISPKQYTSAVNASLAEYNKASIVVISRTGTEGGDFSLDPNNITDGDRVHHALQLQNNEREVIALAKQTSDKVIVLINSDHALEIDELKKDDGIDAILWIGATGVNGIYGVADILVGDVNPSGGLADTFAVDIANMPASINFGDFTYSNIEDSMQSKYVIYQEGIYVGYKYYETRYEDAVLGRYNATSGVGTVSDSWNYDNEVSFAFGYGLSYTTFSEEITEFNVDFAARKATLSVKVTNTGNVKGKHAVQVYAQSPYTEFDANNGIEKAAVQLVAYDKTTELAAGAYQTLDIDINLDFLATYDHVVNKTYIMEKGDYYFAVGNGAHDALNNILAAKGASGMIDVNGAPTTGNAAKAFKEVKAADDFTTYSVSSYGDGKKIENRLDDGDINYYGIDVKYLSRADWQNTFPTPLTGLAATDKMKASLVDGASYTKTDATEEDKAKMVYDSKATSYQLADLREVEFDSDKWEKLIDQLSLFELTRLVGGTNLTPINSITFTGAVSRDGPSGTKANYTDGKYKNAEAVMFQSEVLLAATFSRELAEAEGRMMGNDSLFLKTNTMYAPGCNIHRTPMSGRNSEYFSEDSVLTSIQAYEEVMGAFEYGLVMGGKHFAFNDQETNRHAIGTFFNEQAGREIYLRAFELPLVNGLGLMSAYNRVGCTYSSAHYGLMHDLLRDEWGFKGYAISDAVGSSNLAKYADGPASVHASLTMFCTSLENTYCGKRGSLNETNVVADPVLFQSMRAACKYNLYAFSRSNAMNGYYSGMSISSSMPFYQVIAIVLTVLFGVLFAASAILYVVFMYSTPNAEKEKENIHE